MARKVIRFEQGWSVIHESFTKVTNLLEFASGEELEYSDQKLYSQVLEWEGPESLMETYFLVYTMCTQGPPHDYAKPIFEKYKESMVEYILFTVLPALREKQGEHMLKELEKRWNHYMVLVRWFSRCLNYLDRFRISVISLSDSTVRTVGEAGVKCFRDWVYVEMNVDVKDTMIAMINREREGDHIDRALLNSGVDFFVKMGMGQTNAYEIDFKTFMLEDTGAFYKRNASSWIQELSGPDFMIKVEECLQQEKDRVGHYLHASTETKLLKTVQEELLSQYCQLQLLEKEHSGCIALLRDGKVEDLSRVYRLFSPILNGLEPVAAIFQKHVTDEGIALVKQATDDAASKKKVEKKDSGGVQEQGFVQRVLDLHDKTLGYVTECFGNHVVFQKAMKEAFEVLCNKDVVGRTSAELLASYCDSLLKKGGNQKLSEEAMEDTLQKVVKFLAYLHNKDLFGEFCRKKLAIRLLFDNSVSEDYEHRILMKMKEQCGAHFTSKMDGMLTDIQVASEN